MEVHDLANRFIDVTLRLIDKATAPLSNVGARLTESSRQWIRAGNQIQKTGRKITNVGTSLTKAVTTPIVSVGVTAVKNFGEVDKSMRLVRSTMGETKWATEDLAGAIKKSAANSVFSMQDATNATLNFARQGFNAKKSAQMLTPALDLAAGTATDLSTVSSGLGNTLKVFSSQGLTASKAADVLAKAQAQANTTTTELFNAMSVGSSTFKTVGWSMQDLAAITGVFGDNFISASEGATAMKTGLARLLSPSSKESVSWIKRLNLHLVNSNGTMKSMTNVQGQLHKSFAKLTQEQKMQAASAIFGKNQMNKWLTLIGTAPKTVKKYRSALNDTKGTANKMGNALMSGVGGSIEKMKSTFDVFKYSVGEAIAKPVKKVIDKITDLMGKFNNLDKAQQKNIIKFALLAAAVGPAIVVFGKMVTTVGKIPETLGKAGEKLIKFKNNARAAQGILSTLHMPEFHMPQFPKLPDNKFFNAIRDKASIAAAHVGGIKTKMISVVTQSKAMTAVSTSFTKVSTAARLASGKIGAMAAQSKILNAVSKGFSFFGSGASKAFSLFGSGLKKLYSPLGKVGSLAGTLGKSIFTLLGPVGTAILVVGALVAAGILLYKNWNKVKKTAGKVFTYVKSVFNACGVSGKSLKKDLEPIGYKFTKIGSHAKKLWVTIKPVMTQIASTAKFVFGTVLGVQIGVAIGVLSSFWHTAKKIISGILKVFDGIITFLTGVFTGNWSKAWNGIKEIFSGVFQSLVSLCKMPLNAVIGVINGAIAGINNLHVKIPNWVPGMGGKEFGIHIPTIPQLAKGTSNWRGGIVQVHEKGGEIIDLPQGSRVYPHDKSVRQAYKDGQAAGRRKTVIQIPKLADTIVVREDADIDKIVDKLAKKLEDTANNVGGGDFEYIY